MSYRDKTLVYSISKCDYILVQCHHNYINVMSYHQVIIEVTLLILTSEVTIVLYGQQYKVTLLVGINKATPVITSSLISV